MNENKIKNSISYFTTQENNRKVIKYKLKNKIIQGNVIKKTGGKILVSTDERRLQTDIKQSVNNNKFALTR